MPILKITLPDGSILDHELTAEVVTVGRAGDNTIAIDDASISGHHGQIAPGGEGYLYKDTGSTNGSRLNGRPCTADAEYALEAGDFLMFGSVESVFDPEHAGERIEQELPENKHTASVAKSSVKPSNFMNASPFQKRTAKKDPACVAIMAFAGVALIAVLALVGLVIGMSVGA